MKRIRGIKTYRFDTEMNLTLGYCTHSVKVMVTEDRDGFDATLYCDDIGMTYFMFGVSKASSTLEGFLDVVEGNLLYYIAEFGKEIMKGEQA